MAKLEGVKVLDMVNGEITRVEYGGEIYEKVDEIKAGDIGLVVEGWGDQKAGEYFIVKKVVEHEDGDKFVYVDGNTFEDVNGYSWRFVGFRKISVQPSLVDRVTAVEAKLNDLSSRVDKLEGKTDDGYRLVTDREPRVGDYVKFDEAPRSYLTAGKYYEITSLTYGDPVIIDDDGDTYFVGDGDEFKVYEKVTEDKPDKPEIEVGDYVRLIESNPSHGLGGARKGDIGKVVEINDSKIRIDFPNHPYWHGLVSEVEKVTDENELKFLRIGRKPGEFKVGDIVRTVSYDGGHPKGTIGEISELRGDSKYVKAVYKSDGVTDQHASIIGYAHTDVELIAPVEARVDRP